MRAYAILLVFGLLANALAQSVVYDSHDTSCSVGADKSQCLYRVDVNITSGFTAAAVGAGNQLTCNKPTGAEILTHNQGGRVFVVTTTPLEVDFTAPCDCSNIVWSINGSTVSWINNNANAVLNECDYCGAAVGNDACTGPAATPCLGAPTCNAATGVCENEDLCEDGDLCTITGCDESGPTPECFVMPKCADKEAECMRGECAAATGVCSYMLDFTLAACDKDNLGDILTDIPSTSSQAARFSTSVDVIGYSSDGDIIQTRTSAFDVNSNGEITTSFEHLTSDQHPDRGGLTGWGIAQVVVFPSLFGVLFAAIVAISSFMRV